MKRKKLNTEHNKFIIYLSSSKSSPKINVTCQCIQGVPGVMIRISGFNSKADSESKRHIHMGPILNGSGVLSF